MFELNSLLDRRWAMWCSTALFALTAASGLSGTAHAQDAADAPAAEPADEQAGLEDIVVTARKREENLQDTPIAITAMSGEMLEEKQITNVAEVAKFAPNVAIQPVANISGSSASITAFIRGVGQTDFNITVDPGVGVYVDGVYVARSVGALLDMADIANVQILRGPQGTLFGKNTIGGAILVNSNQPSDRFELRAEVATGRFNRADGRGIVNIPLGDTMAMRAVASYETRDGYMKRLSDGKRQGNKDSFGGRLAFKWDVTPNFTANLAGDVNIRREESAPTKLLAVADSPTFNPLLPSSTYWWNKVRSGSNCGADGQPAPLDNPACFTSRWVTDDVDTTWAGGLNQSDFDLWGTNLTLDWDIGDFALKSITAYRDQKSTIGYDFDVTPLPVLQLTNNIDLWQFSQELQFNGSLFDDRLKFTSGLYYLKEKGSDLNELLFGFSDFFSGGKIDNDSYAAYTQFTFDVTDRLSITPGIRYTNETKRFDPSVQVIHTDYTAGVVPGFPDGVYVALSRCVVSRTPQPFSPFCAADPVYNPGGNHILPAVEVSAKAKEWTPAVSLDYEFTDDILGYVSYSKGFKNGGFTQRIFPAEAVTPSFDPEFVKTYEAGLKTQLFDRRLRLNAAAFLSDYSDIQIVVNEGIAPKVRNAGTARIKGFEIEGEAAPIDWLRVNFGLGYLDAYYRSVSPTAFPVNEDSKFPFVPEWTASSAFNADVYKGDMGTFTLRGDWSYQSKTFKDAVNNPQLFQPGYSVFGASASFTDPSEHYTITAGVTNLGDERYLQGGYVDMVVAGIANAVYARPREWFLKLAYKY